MRQLIVFNNISLDGYFTDAGNDMSFAKPDVEDAEYSAFVGQNVSGDGILVFGRITYQMMANFWPTPMAEQMMPEVAKGMNARQKIVFSRTLREAPWSNTTLVSDDAVEYIRGLKEQPGPNLAVLGSGQIVSQLAQAELVDEYQFVIVPVVLGKGRTLFETVTGPLTLRLTSTRSFQNGNVLTTYEGARNAAADHSVHLV